MPFFRSIDKRKGLISFERYALMSCAITLFTSIETFSGTFGGNPSSNSSVSSFVCVTSLMVSTHVRKFSLLALGSLSYLSLVISNVCADLDNFLNKSLDEADNDEKPDALFAEFKCDAMLASSFAFLSKVNWLFSSCTLSLPFEAIGEGVSAVSSGFSVVLCAKSTRELGEFWRERRKSCRGEFTCFEMQRVADHVGRE